MSGVEERKGTAPLSVGPAEHQGRDSPDIPQRPPLHPENLHLVSVQPSGWQDEGKLHTAWNQTGGFKKGVPASASDEPPRKVSNWASE